MFTKADRESLPCSSPVSFDEVRVPAVSNPLIGPVGLLALNRLATVGPFSPCLPL